MLFDRRQKLYMKRTFINGVENRLEEAGREGSVLLHLRELLRSASEATSALRSRRIDDATLKCIKKAQQKKVRRPRRKIRAFPLLHSLNP